MNNNDCSHKKPLFRLKKSLLMIFSDSTLSNAQKVEEDIQGQRRTSQRKKESLNNEFIREKGEKKCKKVNSQETRKN